MTKKVEDMPGTPPHQKKAFSCKRYRENITPVSIRKLIVLVELEKQNRRSPYSEKVLAGVIDFLLNTDFHNLEGRGMKKSFARTELETAVSYLDENLTIQYLVYRYKFAVYSVNRIVNDFPIVLAIEPTSLCNLKCTMCFQADRSFFTSKPLMGFMDMDLYRRIIDEANEHQLCSIVLASRGEPMLHKNLAEMIRYANRKRIIDVKLNTNATRLTEEKSRELLEAEPKTLVFSVDAGNKEEFEAIRVGADFDKVVQNITRFNDIRAKEFSHSQTRTRISMTVFRATQDVKEAENCWSGLVDEFAVNPSDYRLDIYEHPPLPDETKACSLLWERLYIWWDGKVNPCDIDYKSCLHLGTVDENTSVQSIWLGEKMQSLRKSHSEGRKNDNYPCSQCYGS
ncbi:MAG: hypothetical protein A2735_00665 [Candidatus Yanofskybacteria bacterium RIFCSPHIGHO2_01_FULL_41_21]|uniref:Radical SAM core domain-containing protein n=1 Tax=Candidatus Yanofskybacteria bacterium RIFCSPHIGHO2_01_FULL_41_21 TaxID=1802660 RepID=A0A1F8EBH1_9BACT|nr:MAG: hypothetical protein A2735_00665 [Candidatus Yanofskybacteria bacterium RIFCSPHIGHO2_01_FULL_41_21]